MVVLETMKVSCEIMILPYRDSTHISLLVLTFWPWTEIPRPGL